MSWKWENFCLEGEVWLLSGDSETIWGHLSSCFRLPGDSHAWSRLDAILPTWRYVTNCFLNVLPRRLFRLVAGQINSLSLLDGLRRRRCLSMAAADSLSRPASFVSPRCSRSWQGWMSRWGAGDKRWQIQNVEYPPICLVFCVFYLLVHHFLFYL